MDSLSLRAGNMPRNLFGIFFWKHQYLHCWSLTDDFNLERALLTERKALFGFAHLLWPTDIDFERYSLLCDLEMDQRTRRKAQHFLFGLDTRDIAHVFSMVHESSALGVLKMVFCKTATGARKMWMWEMWETWKRMWRCNCYRWGNTSKGFCIYDYLALIVRWIILELSFPGLLVLWVVYGD
jgi:hypothetical protein